MRKPTRSATGSPSSASSPQLECSRAVFDEAQRLQGALLLTREALADDEIAGARIPAGTLVGVSSYSLHRNPEFWPDAERFDPTRFMGERRQSQHRYQFLPFGAGPRHCIGANLAYLEAQLTLLAVARRFTIELEPGYVPRHRFHLSTGLVGGLPCRLRGHDTDAVTPGAVHRAHPPRWETAAMPRVSRSAELDDTDRRILELLAADGRASNRFIAERVGLTDATVATRIRRLRDDGVVGVTAVFDWELAGFGWEAFLFVEVDGRLPRDVGTDIADAGGEPCGDAHVRERRSRRARARPRPRRTSRSS